MLHLRPISREKKKVNRSTLLRGRPGNWKRLRGRKRKRFSPLKIPISPILPKESLISSKISEKRGRKLKPGPIFQPHQSGKSQNGNVIWEPPISSATYQKDKSNYFIIKLIKGSSDFPSSPNPTIPYAATNSSSNTASPIFLQEE